MTIAIAWLIGVIVIVVTYQSLRARDKRRARECREAALLWWEYWEWHVRRASVRTGLSTDAQHWCWAQECRHTAEIWEKRALGWELGKL